MKNLTSILIISVLASGCASTGNDLPMVNNQVVFPPLKVISENKYEWDDSISEALNIAKLAQPAGVGNDMSDATDGTTVTLNRNTSGNRLLEGALGLATGGLMGALSSDNLNRINNELIEWKPTIVELVNKDTISENGKIDFRKARNFLATKIRAAVSVDYPNLVWGEPLTLKSSEFKHTLWQVMYDDVLCLELRKHDALRKDKVEDNYKTLSDHFHEGKDELVNACYLIFDISVSKETTEGELALVAQMTKGFMLADELAKNYQGYVMVPDIYFINDVEKITYDYAYVAKSGEKLLFQTPK
jgi:hypothetical protein